MARARALYRVHLVLRFIASQINVRQKVARFEGGRHPPSRGTVEERPSIAFEDIAKDNDANDPELRSRGVRGQALSIVDLSTTNSRTLSGADKKGSSRFDPPPFRFLSSTSP